MSEPIRVLQYGVGPIGAAIVRLLAGKRGVTWVGGVDLDPEKAGRDLGEVAGMDRPLGVKVGREAGTFLKAGVDVVVHATSSWLEKVKGQLTECLEAGAHVVSTCEELAYPQRKHPELSARLDECARKNGCAIVGVGVNPGFAMDKLVLVMSTVCHRVDRVEVKRIVDASKRRLPLQLKVGAGITAEEFERRVAEGAIKHHGLPESAALIADRLGFGVETIEETIKPVMATEAVRSEYLEVPAGRVAGVHQVAVGKASGEEKVRLELQMYMGAPDPIDEVRIFGVPDLHVQAVGGIHGDLATAAVAVNCVPLIGQVPPGLRTVADIPMAFLPPA